MHRDELGGQHTLFRGRLLHGLHLHLLDNVTLLRPRLPPLLALHTALHRPRRIHRRHSGALFLPLLLFAASFPALRGGPRWLVIGFVFVIIIAVLIDIVPAFLVLLILGAVLWLDLNRLILLLSTVPL